MPPGWTDCNTCARCARWLCALCLCGGAERISQRRPGRSAPREVGVTFVAYGRKPAGCKEIDWVVVEKPPQADYEIVTDTKVYRPPELGGGDG